MLHSVQDLASKLVVGPLLVGVLGANPFFHSGQKPGEHHRGPADADDEPGGILGFICQVAPGLQVPTPLQAHLPQHPQHRQQPRLPSRLPHKLPGHPELHVPEHPHAAEGHLLGGPAAGKATNHWGDQGHELGRARGGGLLVQVVENLRQGGQGLLVDVGILLLLEHPDHHLRQPHHLGISGVHHTLPRGPQPLLCRIGPADGLGHLHQGVEPGNVRHYTAGTGDVRLLPQGLQGLHDPLDHLGVALQHRYHRGVLIDREVQ
mmetsp:Transcript_40754/g.91874  ORF Transcript_40754/g.91874 Transcript_40754/m.91874 type:complete len:262 (+) Transcript_40754:1564-2349(+)